MVYSGQTSKIIGIAVATTGHHFDRTGEVESAADNEYQRDDDDGGVAKAGKDFVGGYEPQQVGNQQRPKGHQVIAVAAPNQEPEQRADQRKQNPLVSGHVGGSSVGGGDLPLELFMEMAHTTLDLIEPATLKTLGVHALLGVG